MHSPGVFDKQKGSVKINFLQIERYLGGLESCLSSPRFPGSEVTCVLGAPTFKPACSIWRTGHDYRRLAAIFYSAQRRGTLVRSIYQEGGCNMNKHHQRSAIAASVALVLLALIVLAFNPIPGRADEGQKTNPPPFDFNDRFYLGNGINPPNILQRVGTSTNATRNWTICQPGDPAPCPNTDQNRNQTRVLQTTGGFAFDGSLLYYSIMGFVTPSTFNTDSSGQGALDIANRRQAFIFPIRQSDGTCIKSPAHVNRRQDHRF